MNLDEVVDKLKKPSVVIALGLLILATIAVAVTFTDGNQNEKVYQIHTLSGPSYPVGFIVWTEYTEGMNRTKLIRDLKSDLYQRLQKTKNVSNQNYPQYPNETVERKNVSKNVTKGLNFFIEDKEVFKSIAESGFSVSLKPLKKAVGNPFETSRIAGLSYDTNPINTEKGLSLGGFDLDENQYLIITPTAVDVENESFSSIPRPEYTSSMLTWFSPVRPKRGFSEAYIWTGPHEFGPDKPLVFVGDNDTIAERRAAKYRNHVDLLLTVLLSLFALAASLWYFSPDI